MPLSLCFSNDFTTWLNPTGINANAADDLATQGDRASVAVVLTYIMKPHDSHIEITDDSRVATKLQFPTWHGGRHDEMYKLYQL